MLSQLSLDRHCGRPSLLDLNPFQLPPSLAIKKLEFYPKLGWFFRTLVHHLLSLFAFWKKLFLSSTLCLSTYWPFMQQVVWAWTLLQFNQPWLENTQERNFKNFQKQNMNLPPASNYMLCNIYNVFGIRSYLEMIFCSRIGEGNGNPLQCSCLENPRDGGAWWAAVYGVTQSRTRLKQLSSSSSSKDDF